MLCVPTDLDHNPAGALELLVSLIDCVNAINLRAAAVKDCEEPMMLLPVTLDDTARLVAAMTEWMTLTQALTMPVKDLNRSTSRVIAVRAPPGMHFVFQKPAKSEKPVNKPRAHAWGDSVSQSSADQSHRAITKFPIADGLRGVTIGKNQFRKPCQRHAREYTRCRCVLPIVSTAAHVAAISMALATPQAGYEFTDS